VAAEYAAVLKALADECTTGIFFTIASTPLLSRNHQAGLRRRHTVGTHTWSHATLTTEADEDQRKEEIEKGFSAVKWALGRRLAGAVLPLPGPAAPAGNGHLSRRPRNRDVSLRSRLVRLQGAQRAGRHDVTMKKLDKLGKGIILMHDFHKHTAEALPDLLKKLKCGYKVVAMKAKAPVQTSQKYDEDVIKDLKAARPSARGQSPAS